MTPNIPRALALGVCAAMSLAISTPALALGSPDLVISQVYGGGGNTGATYTNDFIEIFNRGPSAVSLSGKSLQYASATGTGNFGVTNQITVLPAVSLDPGQYYLVKEAGGANGAPFSADLVVTTGAINMSASGGKVALVNSTTSLGCNGGSTACSPAALALIIDLIGYDGANFFEGSGTAPTLNAINAAFRAGAGCTDSDDNKNDFSAATPSPRTSSSAIHSCVPSTSPTISASASPSSVSAGDSTTLTVTVTPGSNPASTGIAVTADLSSIGGLAAQAFNDGGSGSFSWLAIVAVNTSIGAKSLPVTATDAQGRSGTGSISLTVTAAVPNLAIHDIQGPTNVSPWADQVVQTEGVVTARKSNGYFIQAPDAEADSDPNTSEGIFVFTSGAPPAAAAVGNRVRVRARAQNFIPASDPASPPVTELANTVSLVSLSSGNALPAAVSLTSADLDPAGSLAQLAKVEGMRVHVDTLNVVAPTGGTISEPNATSTSNGIFFGVLPGTARPFREPGLELPQLAPAGVPQFDANPERLRVDSDGQTGAARLDVATGAVVSGLTGVLDFGSRTYTLDPDPGTPPSVTNNDAHAIPVRPGAGEGEIAVASFNMERFYDTTDAAGTSDAVLNAAGFERRLSKASLVIRNVLQMPDIIGVEEMENLSTLQAVAARVDADAAAAGQTPPGYQAYLVEGNDVGGIDVGLLVKASRIEAVQVEQIDTDENGLKPIKYTQIDGTQALLNDRPPLVLTANVKRVGKELPLAVTVIVNHLRSLSGIDDPLDGPRVQYKRLKQAEFLAALIDGYQQFGEKVISVGDYNAFDVNDGYADMINTIIGGTPRPTQDLMPETGVLVSPPLVDLAPSDPAQHYSYVFAGNAQVLDHIIVSQSLAVNEFTYARNDADFPESLRADATRPERISDHDMPVAYFAVARDTVPPSVFLSGAAEGAIYLLGTVPATTCTTTDDASGVKTPAILVVSGGDADGVGAITATCTGAVDNVGNVGADVSVHYQVVAYAFTGFAPPLASGAITVKGGSTVPLKFQLRDWNGNLVTDTAVIAGIQVARSAACSGTPGDGWEDATATGGTLLRFDGGQFIFNWKTTGLAPGCYAIGVRTIDTLTHAASVTLR